MKLEFAAPVLVCAILLAACGGDADNPSEKLPTATAATASIEASGSPATPTNPLTGSTDWIAYQTLGQRGEIIRLIHPDGTDDHEIAGDAPGEHLLPDWSPDGRQLVYTTRGIEGEPLFLYDLASDSAEQLFECIDPCLGDDEPAFSPDGDKIAFIRALGPLVNGVPSDCGLWIGTIEKREVTRLTSNETCQREYNPRWSPDGSKLVYSRPDYTAVPPQTSAIYTINADGTGEQVISDPALVGGSPDWNPNGESIVFGTYPLHEFDCCHVSNLYRIATDGSQITQLSSYENDAVRITQPSYSPDGEWIVFTNVTSSNVRKLAFIPRDGGEPVVIGGMGFATHSRWQPTQ